MQIGGLDWSGAADAGKKTWLALGTASTTLRIDSLERAADHGARRPVDVRQWVLERLSPGTWLGCDFPFSLPDPVMNALDLDRSTLVAELASRFPRASDLRDAARAVLDHEPRRQTDHDRGTPWAPTNLRMVAQTHSGLLLVQSATDCRILPWDVPAEQTALFEVCPAVVLESLGLGGVRYKGKKRVGAPNRDRRNAREAILDRVTSSWPVEVPEPLRDTAVDDADGDAIDAILAAASAWWDCARLPIERHRELQQSADEGWVYSRPEAH